MEKLIWLPIDIPKFPIDIDEFLQDKKIQNWENLSWWKFKKLTDASKNSYEISSFEDHIKKLYPSLIEWFNFFPYKTIRNIKLNVQQSRVGSHIDFANPNNNLDLFNNNKNNEPCGYRVLIKGKRSNTLYIEHNNCKIYTILPEDTDVYVLRHTDGRHGVDKDTKRITLFTHFEIDSIKHQLLLEKSLKKYKEYTILGD
jgi:hypothetical protein